MRRQKTEDGCKNRGGFTFFHSSGNTKQERCGKFIYDCDRAAVTMRSRKNNFYRAVVIVLKCEIICLAPALFPFMVPDVLTGIDLEPNLFCLSGLNWKRFHFSARYHLFQDFKKTVGRFRGVNSGCFMYKYSR